MLYCPLLPCAGPVATARGVPVVVLKLTELQKTSRVFCPQNVYEDKVSYETAQDAQVSFIASARHFTARSSFCGPQEKRISDLVKTNSRLGY